MTTKNQIPLALIAVAIIIAILFVYFWMSGMLIPMGTTNIETPPPVNVTSTFIDTNFSLSNLPPEVKQEIRTIDNSIHLNKWEFSATNNNVINLYAYDIRDESEIEGLQGKRIGNYTIHILHDIEFETSRSEVEAFLLELMKNPDYQIASIGTGVNTLVDPTEYNAELWCYSLTPENKKLDKTVIKGWNIIVRPMAPPPTSPIERTISSNKTL